MAYTIAHKMAGQKVLNKFLERYRYYNGTSIPQDVLIKNVTSSKPEDFINTLGGAFIGGLEEDEEKLSDAMDNLARQTKGKVPTSSDFFQAMRDVNGTFTYIGKALVDSAEELGSMAADFGQGSLFILKVFTGYFPFIFFGSIAAFVYFNKESFRFSKDEILGAFKK